MCLIWSEAEPQQTEQGSPEKGLTGSYPQNWVSGCQNRKYIYTWYQKWCLNGTWNKGKEGMDRERRKERENQNTRRKFFGGAALLPWCVEGQIWTPNFIHRFLGRTESVKQLQQLSEAHRSSGKETAMATTPSRQAGPKGLET